MKKIYSLLRNLSATICFLTLSANAQTLTPCSGIPGSNTVVPLNNPVCLGMSGTLTLANGYNVLGITYQWQSSTVSMVGPFSSIPGATTNIYVVPTLTQTTYFQVVITCTNGGQSTIASVAQLSVATTVTNSVPYYEGFQGISNTNQLPNCSWAASNLGTSCLTFTSGAPPFSGSKCAGFYQLPIGTNYFYTNGILLNAGVTYSASVWYNTTSSLTSNWSNLSIMLGATQSTNGLTTLASVNNPVALNYINLSNTFTVASTGIYYVAIKGVSTNTAVTQYLYWDDLSITIPCTPLINPVTLTVTSSTNNSFVCSGQSFTLTASGAHTYLWSNGSTSPVITSSQVTSGSLSVIGTNSLSGCTATNNVGFSVIPLPIVSIITSSPTICAGQSTNLNAFGANTYTWSTGSTGNIISVSPLTNTVYSVIGSNQFGCTNSFTQTITVNILPNIISFISSNTICAGETVTLSATGANVYQWFGNALNANGIPVTASPSTSEVYTVIGTDNNGCANTSTLSLAVNPCLSLNETNSEQTLAIFPNPNKGEFEIRSNNNLIKIIKLFDVNGRLVLSFRSSKENIKAEMKDLPDGIYHLNISSNTGTKNFKIIRQ